MKRTLILIFVIVASLATLGLVIWYGGATFGDLSWQGWLALVLGVIGTAALGGFLMGMVYFSSRAGYDDRAAERPTEDEPTISDTQNMPSKRK